MSEEQLYDLSQLREVSAGSEEFVDKMIDLFISMTPALVKRIETGLQMEDWDEVGSAAHKMKPSIDMMGITLLKSKIREIEGNAKNRTRLGDIPGLLTYLTDTLDQVYIQLRTRETD